MPNLSKLGLQQEEALYRAPPKPSTLIGIIAAPPTNPAPGVFYYRVQINNPKTDKITYVYAKETNANFNKGSAGRLALDQPVEIARQSRTSYSIINVLIRPDEITATNAPDSEIRGGQLKDLGYADKLISVGQAGITLHADAADIVLQESKVSITSPDAIGIESAVVSFNSGDDTDNTFINLEPDKIEARSEDDSTHTELVLDTPNTTIISESGSSVVEFRVSPNNALVSVDDKEEFQVGGGAVAGHLKTVLTGENWRNFNQVSINTLGDVSTMQSRIHSALAEIVKATATYANAETAGTYTPPPLDPVAFTYSYATRVAGHRVVADITLNITSGASRITHYTVVYGFTYGLSGLGATDVYTIGTTTIPYTGSVKAENNLLTILPLGQDDERTKNLVFSILPSGSLGSSPTDLAEFRVGSATAPAVSDIIGHSGSDTTLSVGPLGIVSGNNWPGSSIPITADSTASYTIGLVGIRLFVVNGPAVDSDISIFMGAQPVARL